MEYLDRRAPVLMARRQTGVQTMNSRQGDCGLNFPRVLLSVEFSPALFRVYLCVNAFYVTSFMAAQERHRQAFALPVGDATRP